MKWVISTAIDSTKANSFLSRMHKSMGKSIINIEKERLYREGSSQEKEEKNGWATMGFEPIIERCCSLGYFNDIFTGIQNISISLNLSKYRSTHTVYQSLFINKANVNRGGRNGMTCSN